MKEIWKDIPEFEGYYQVSNLGKVKSLERYVVSPRGGMALRKERILKISENRKSKYLQVSLCKDGYKKVIAVHILVAIAFLKYDRNSELVCDHIDNNQKNNNLNNLQLTTIRHNSSKDRQRKSKFHGISFHKCTGKWASSIMKNGKTIHLGVFETEKEAHTYYQNAVKSIIDGKEIEIKRNGSSKYRGVFFNSSRKKWVVKKYINGKAKQFGSFETEQKAIEKLKSLTLL